MPSYAVIFPAAGKSSRFHGKEKKPFTNLDGRAVWLRSVEHFITRPDVAQCIIVISPDDQEMFRRRFGANLAFMNVQIANGGAERFESVANALTLVKPEVDFVAIHDAVRPCLTESLINDVFAKAEKTDAAMLAVPVADTLKEVDPQ
jgi:2-C-methyl-D-erythritol 4-phosphate cytidylyltransferase